MEEALMARLLASAGVAALVADRITWDDRPQASALPSIVLQVIDGVPEYSDEGTAGLTASRIQIDCWTTDSNTKSGSTLAKQIGRAVIDALPIEFMHLGVAFEAFLDAMRDFAPEIGQGGVKMYRRSLDFEIWHSA